MPSRHTACMQAAANQATVRNVRLHVAARAVCLSDDSLSLFVIGSNQVYGHLHWWISMYILNLLLFKFLFLIVY